MQLLANSISTYFLDMITTSSYKRNLVAMLSGIHRIPHSNHLHILYR